MNSTTKSLQNALQKVNINPETIVSDNGTEFVGHLFQNELKKNEIASWRTQPYTPQKNGKIELFWQTLIKSSKKDFSIEAQLNDIISEYNVMWEHKFLKQLYNQPKTPQEVWIHGPQWSSDSKYEIIYYE